MSQQEGVLGVQADGQLGANLQGAHCHDDIGSSVVPTLDSRQNLREQRRAVSIFFNHYNIYIYNIYLYTVMVDND